MPFPYYDRLSAKNKKIYRQSDQVHKVTLQSPQDLFETVYALDVALNEEKRALVMTHSQELVNGVNQQLGVPTAFVRVLASRPSHTWGELYGLYEPEASPLPRITVWMRTAQQKKVVAFKTYLRTLLHELLHHLDYEHLALAESFHTEGFFKRESDLARQLLNTHPRQDGRSSS